MKRRTPLKPGKPLRRKTKMRTRNDRRRDEAFVKAFHSPERVKFVAGLPCVVCGARPSENHHVRSRGAGGTYREVVPLCTACHARYHAIGKLAMLQAARKARHFAPLLVWDAQWSQGSARGLWREAESWEGAAEIVQHIWENRQ